VSATATRPLNTAVLEATGPASDVRFAPPTAKPSRNALVEATAFDEAETRAIEADDDLYARVVDRLNRPGESLPASDLLSE
jgi:hypothetical protein